MRILSFTLLLLSSCLSIQAQGMIKNKMIDHKVYFRGAMSKVMHEGDLTTAIDIDTLADKNYLCGIGALENMTGEILILDGIGYKSTINKDHKAEITQTSAMKAPFFAYTHVKDWQEVVLPDTIFTLSSLEHYINQVTQKFPRPFFFRVISTVDSAQIHILNLPKGTKIRYPEDAHKDQQTFNLVDKQVDLVGLFSTEHQGIFTHHDTFMHIHLITQDRQQMGHLDNIIFKPGFTRLLLPRL